MGQMTAAFIAELNPLHNGHAYLVSEAKKRLPEGTDIVAVMSGNFVQRGAPSCTDKWTRAEMAVAAGADAVAEIPPMYSCSSAQYFAECGVKLARAAGAKTLFFGSETGDIGLLTKIARFKAENPEKLADEIGTHMKDGASYPAAFQKAVDKLTGGEKLLPNDILGAEYIAANIRLGFNIDMMCIKRTGNVPQTGGFKDSEGKIACAKGLREHISSSKDGDISALLQYIPEKAYNIFSKRMALQKRVADEDSLSQFIIGEVRTIGAEVLREKLPFMTAGIENLLYDACCRYGKISEIADNCTSAAYTRTRITRALYQIAAMSEKSDFDGNETHPEMLRVLAVSKEKKTMLGRMSESAEKAGLLFVPGNIPADFKNNAGISTRRRDFIEREIKSTDVYAVSFENSEISRAGLELSKPLIVC